MSAAAGDDVDEQARAGGALANDEAAAAAEARGRAQAAAKTDSDKVALLVATMWPVDDDNAVDVNVAWDRRTSAFVIGVLFDRVPHNETDKRAMNAKLQQACEAKGVVHKVEMAFYG